MASQSGGEARSSSAAAQAATPPAGGQPDELLCTICGLTACWTAPGKPPRPATTADGPVTETATPG